MDAWEVYTHAAMYNEAVQRYERDVRADLERLRHQFTNDYVGGNALPTQLQQFLTACATRCADEPWRFRVPCVSVVQSTGFGKSRVLRELAKQTKDDPMGPMKVLYVCARPPSDTSALPLFPKPTVHLCEYLFPDTTADPWHQGVIDQGDTHEMLEAKLWRVYTYAVDHWDTVGDEWFALLDHALDTVVRSQLDTHATMEATSRRSDRPRIVVLAIDEARFLTSTPRHGHVAWIHTLRTALGRLAPRIRATCGPSACLLTVLVDSSLDIVGGVPATGPTGGTVDDLPPFVLTQTMDIRFRAVVDDARRRGQTPTQLYQALLARDATTTTQWQTLVCMGRPLWDRVALHDVAEKETRQNVLRLAAAALVGEGSADRGAPDSLFGASSADGLTPDSLFGVASVLCRVGVRIPTRSPLASRLVADFFATLVYVPLDRNQLVVTYPSEPVLTFGAARVWYQSTGEDAHARLSAHILPQLIQLLGYDLVASDSGGDSATLVSRLVLLLAIDTTGLALAESHPIDNPRVYAGELYSVEAFLEVLYGIDPIVVRDRDHNDVTETFADALDHALARYHAWQLGFSHFVELTAEPSDDDLWAMLARRAAGVFARTWNDVDLVLPMFKDVVVSMLLVQVERRPQHDGASLAATKRLRPSWLFTTARQQRRPDEVVRIYMNWQGSEGTSRTPFYLVDASGTELSSFVLCMEGLSAWRTFASCDTVAHDAGLQGVHVMSEALATQLRKLLALSGPSLELGGLEDGSRPSDSRVGEVTMTTRAGASRRGAPKSATKTILTKQKRAKKGKKS